MTPRTLDEALSLAYQHYQAGDLHGAEAIYRYILAGDPLQPDALHFVGAIAQHAGRCDIAIDYMKRSIALRPTSEHFLCGLGHAYAQTGNHLEAMECFAQALKLRPGFSEAHNSLANTWQMLRQFDKAVACYHDALRLVPDYPEAHANLGVALQAMGDLDQAVVHLRKACQLRPGFVAALLNLGNILHLQGHAAEALACQREVVRLAPDDIGAHSLLLCRLNYMPEVPAEAIFTEHRQWGSRFAGADGALQTLVQDRNPERQLRVGYVSPDLRWHPIACFLEPILTNHNRDQIFSICYSDVAMPDDVTARLRALASAWRDVHTLNDHDLAHCVREDRIDILVDLVGHTGRNRLVMFAMKPAPVQATYLGYPATTGLLTVDYRLTDEVADPPGEPTHHTEELIRLPRGFCCYAPYTQCPEAGSPPCMESGHVTFGSLHGLPKLNHAVLDLWCEILHAAPNTRLLLYRSTLRGSAKRALEQHIASRGIKLARIEIRDNYAGEIHHLDAYHQIDIALDVFPWTGHTTACEALWMGVPVVTLRGTKHAGRMVASVLTHAGLPELIAEDPKQYVQIAVELGQNLKRLADLRLTLRDKLASSPLCDGVGFTRSLEAAYREMWRRRCAAM